MLYEKFLALLAKTGKRLIECLKIQELRKIFFHIGKQDAVNQSLKNC